MMPKNKKFDLCGLGNALVDIQFQVNDNVITESGLAKGEMRLAGKDEQNELIKKLSHLNHNKCSGGSAANTVIAFSQFGGKAAYLTMLGNDDNGRFYASEFHEIGIKLSTDYLDDEPTGTCLVLITPDSERTMYTCLAATSKFTKTNLDKELVESSKWLYIEGYSFSQQHTTEAIFEAVDIAQKAGVKISVTFSDVFVTQVFRESLLYVVKNCDLLFCNENEALSFTGKENVADAMSDLASLCPNVIITLGSKGAKVNWEGKIYEISPFPSNPIDSTGAGDMFAAGFLYGIIYFNDPVRAGNLGSLAASKVITALGARLDKNYVKELINGI
jgi:sugar/nucleoside kinase (ribokinase family)